jgi:hypothetical protein
MMTLVPLLPHSVYGEDAADSACLFRAYRVELDPTVEQRRTLGRQDGAARWVYNWALAEWRRRYDAGERPTWCCRK